MKKMTSTHFCLLIALGGAAIAGGQPVRSDINPALLYYRASQLAPDLSPPDRDYLFNNDWRGQKLPERFGDLLARYDNQFKLARQAAGSSAPCDWGIDLSPGPATLLPHLARNKAIAQAARLRAMWDLQQGRPADAAEDLLAALALARNGSRDGTLISALVQIAIENIVCATVAENFYQFSPETLKTLADGIDTAPARGTVAGCVSTEKSFFHDWLTGKILKLQQENPGNDAKALAAIQELIAGLEGQDEGQTNQVQPRLWELVTKAAGGTSAGILKLLADEEPFFQKLAAAMAAPYPESEDQMKQFSEDIQKSSNPFVRHMFPAWEKCRKRELPVLVALAMVRAGVEYKLHGEEGLKSVTDPCGSAPFAFQRFMFEGVDRGFELKSAYNGLGFPSVLIFVETEGSPFEVKGKDAGQAVPKSATTK